MIITQKIEAKRKYTKIKKNDLCKSVGISETTYWRFLKTGNLDFIKIVKILDLLELELLIYDK